MRILPSPSDPWQHKALIWSRLFIGLAVAIFGVLTQFNVTVNQSVTKPQIIKRVVATRVVGAPEPVVKDGMVTEADCYAFAKNPSKWSSRKMLDTFGVPKGGGGDYSSALVYRIKNNEERNCTIGFYGDHEHVTTVDLDLYVSFG